VRLSLKAATAALLVLTGQAAWAQSTTDRIAYGQCTATNIVIAEDAQYAAAVGVMTTESADQAKLLAGVPSRRGSDLCARRVSDAFCDASFLDFAITSLITSMTAGSAGEHFFTALGLSEAAEDAGGNVIGLTAGLGGAILGGVMGSGDGLLGIAKGGAIGGGIGFGLGSIADKKIVFDRCANIQSEFSDLTRRMLASGFRPQRHHRQLFAEIDRVTARLSTEDRRLGEQMIEAMAVSAAKIDSIR
jgi:hypothetical protein